MHKRHLILAAAASVILAFIAPEITSSLPDGLEKVMIGLGMQKPETGETGGHLLGALGSAGIFVFILVIGTLIRKIRGR